MTLIAPLDLQTLFINTFAGSTLIFIGIALFFIAGLSARFRMPNIIFGSMIALFGILMMPIASWLYVLIIIVIGTVVGYTFTRIVKS